MATQKQTKQLDSKAKNMIIVYTKNMMPGYHLKPQVEAIGDKQPRVKGPIWYWQLCEKMQTVAVEHLVTLRTVESKNS